MSRSLAHQTDEEPGDVTQGLVDLDISENGVVRFRLRTTRERLAELNRRLSGDSEFRRLFWMNPVETLAAYGVEADREVLPREVQR